MFKMETDMLQMVQQTPKHETRLLQFPRRKPTVEKKLHFHQSLNHRWLRLEGSTEDNLVQPP